MIGAENFIYNESVLSFYKTVVDEILTKKLKNECKQLTTYKLETYNDDNTERKLYHVRYLMSYKNDVTKDKLYIVFIVRSVTEPPMSQKEYDNVTTILHVWKEMKAFWHTNVANIATPNNVIFNTISEGLTKIVQKIWKTHELHLVPDNYTGSIDTLTTSFGEFTKYTDGTMHNTHTYIKDLFDDSGSIKSITAEFANVIFHIQEKFKDALIDAIKKLNLRNDLLNRLVTDLFNGNYCKTGIIKIDDIRNGMGHTKGTHNYINADIENACELIDITRTLFEETVDLNQYFEHYDNYISCQALEFVSPFLMEKQKSAMMKIYVLSKQLHNFMRPSLFSGFLSDTDFLTQDELRENFTLFLNLNKAVVGQYGLTVSLLQSKMDDYNLQNGRNTGFLLYAAALDVYTKEKSDMTLFKYLNIGLIEYYNDCLQLIMDNMINNYPFVSTDGSKPNQYDVDKFIYNNHYVIIKLLHEFTRWFIEEYIPKKSTTPGFNIFEYSIDVNETCNNDTDKISGGAISLALRLLNEYKDFLADYQANFGQQVSIHMRINDRTDTPGSWTENERVFYNNKLDRNNLRINFDKMCKETVKDDGIDSKNLDHCKLRTEAAYKETFEKRKKIPFTRIYNTEAYKDAAVIANYMSLSSYIKSKKGALMMTYGYSGVGKTYTLFGGSGVKGVLQNALEEFSINDDIYLRVYEIYGLGTQYWYYWNKSIEDFYHVIFHYKINTSNVSIDGVEIIEHPEDMQRYIMTLPNSDCNDIKRMTKPSSGPNTYSLSSSELYRKLHKTSY